MENNFNFMTYEEREKKYQDEIKKIDRQFLIGGLILFLFIAICLLSIPSVLKQQALNEPIVVLEPQVVTVTSFTLINVSSGVVREVTAFNSVPEQTDDTPCIAANGTNICERFAVGECLIAGNFAKFETKHYLEGIGLCTLIDRMNARYPERVDLFFDKDLKGARNFGIKKIMVKS